MARLVEILQVESVVPNLLDGGTVEILLPDLELNDHDRGANQQHRINSAAEAGDCELEKDRATEPRQGVLQYDNLLYPGFALGLLQVVPAGEGQPPDDRVRFGSEKFVDGGSVPRTRVDFGQAGRGIEWVHGMDRSGCYAPLIPSLSKLHVKSPDATHDRGLHAKAADGLANCLAIESTVLLANSVETSGNPTGSGLDSMYLAAPEPH